MHVAHVTVDSITCAAPGGRVPALLIVPDREEKRAGVIFMHGYGGSRNDSLEEGVGLSLFGADVVTITSRFALSRGPSGRLMIRNVVDLRRGSTSCARGTTSIRSASLRRLRPRCAGGRVDGGRRGPPERRRPAGAAVASGRCRRDLRHRALHIRSAAPARLYFQGATYDEGVPARELSALIAAAPKPTDYKWYDTSHSFEPLTFRDQIAWLRDRLGLRRS